MIKNTLLIMALLALVISCKVGSQIPCGQGPAMVAGQPQQATPQCSDGMLQTSYAAADALHAVLASRMGPRIHIAAAALVDMDNLEKTSPFGRLAAQQIGSRLTQYGYRIIEARLRQDLAVRPGEGEFLLSRESMKLMSTDLAAQAALVGGYRVTPNTIFVSLRMVRLEDGVIVGAHEYSVPNRGTTAQLADPGFGDRLWAKYAHRKDVAGAGEGINPEEHPKLPEIRRIPGSPEYNAGSALTPQNFPRIEPPVRLPSSGNPY